ncbi:MAG: TolC family protein [Planctomyces sp.]|nr:TolC family protein [Planctomyces sp.]
MDDDASDLAFEEQFKARVYAVDLGSVLELTAGRSPQVGFAQQRIQESLAQLQMADVLWAPSIRAGLNYNKHEGRIQDVQGEIINTSRGSFYGGLGSMAVGAGSPAVPGLYVNMHLRDAIFQPRIAEQRLGASQQASRAVTNDTLLEAALAYLDLLEAFQTKAVAEVTLANSMRLAALTESFAEAGQGTQADADRARAELSLRRLEVQRSIENCRVASAKLAIWMRHDQSWQLAPLEPSLTPITLVDSPKHVAELVATGLRSRPELAEHQFLVCEAIERMRREEYAPLIPSVFLGTSYGGNGGGLGSELSNFGDRWDFDVAAYWEVRNLGYGEHAIRKESRSRVEQARWKQMQIMDLVASEVAEAHAQVEERRRQIDLAESAIASAGDSYRRNVERIRDGQGLPIETLQSIQALDQSQRQYVRSVADYNRAQFRLQRALGWPVHDVEAPGH